MSEGFELIFDDKQGVWVEKPEIYGSIECATEEDYNFALKAIKAARNATVAYKLDSRKKSIKYCCSECKGTFYMYDKYDYCPRCGAHIVGVEG
ncbi:MAG: hypothetical protein IKY46_03495 [Clostridia bacterium]|nr:hypothetical protein [Clostridia bacterium]